jgi:hypothetical protein
MPLENGSIRQTTRRRMQSRPAKRRENGRKREREREREREKLREDDSGRRLSFIEIPFNRSANCASALLF